MKLITIVLQKSNLYNVKNKIEIIYHLAQTIIGRGLQAIQSIK